MIILTTSMLPILLQWLALACLCYANTETHLIKVPHYFNIPNTPTEYRSRDPYQVNSTHIVLEDYPIQSIQNLQLNNTVVVSYNSLLLTRNTLLVRVNDYNGTTYTSDDMLSVKLCWPATEPYTFDLSHRFVKTADIIPHGDNQLALYVQVDYEFEGKTYNLSLLSENEDLIFHLHITKLPLKWLPIPAELYEFIVIFVDLLIISVVTTPYLYKYLFASI